MKFNFPCLMYVGNNIVDGSQFGKNAKIIVAYKDGKFYAENGFSWKYAKIAD